jgi:hypothetical protein
MSYSEDLYPCNYFGFTDPRLIGVGWLDPSHSFRQAAVDKAHYEALGMLAANPWQPFVSAGRHRCQFCRFSGGPATIRIGDVDVAVGASNVFVPSSHVVYVAPSQIVHYIDAHEYSPPDEFMNAVLSCPPMRSTEYLRMLMAHSIIKLFSSRTSGR